MTHVHNIINFYILLHYNYIHIHKRNINILERILFS